jgi:hypothetical protein
VIGPEDGAWSEGAAGVDVLVMSSSGSTNNASKGVDERVWAVQLVEHAVTKHQSEDDCAGRKPEPVGAWRPPSRSAQAGRTTLNLSTLVLPFGR